MNRCTQAKNLEVHHKRRDGGNGFNNAKVLCPDCHSKTSTYGVPGKSPLPFSESVKSMALTLAGNRCECTSDRGCH